MEVGRSCRNKARLIERTIPPDRVVVLGIMSVNRDLHLKTDSARPASEVVRNKRAVGRNQRRKPQSTCLGGHVKKLLGSKQWLPTKDHE